MPIALAAFLAPALGIDPESVLFLPMIVVLLELIIDPTCSIVLEREPAESDIMERKPRDPGKNMITAETLIKSILHGLAIFAASFGAYYYTLHANPENAGAARAMGIGVIMFANLFLVQVNCSDIDSIFTSIKRLAKDKVIWAVNIIITLSLILFLYTPINSFLKLAPLTSGQFLTVLGLAAASVLWYEVIKLIKRIRR